MGKGKQSHPKKENSTLFVFLWSVVSFASIAHWTPFSIDFHFISLAQRRSLFSLTFPIAPLCLLLSQREIYNGGYRLLPAPPHYSLSLPWVSTKAFVLALRKDAGATLRLVLLVFRDSRRAILDSIASNSLLTITPDLYYYPIINGARAKNSIDFFVFVFQRGRLYCF